MKPITIITICVICAATLMSGCLESGDPVSDTRQPYVKDVFDEMEDNFAEADRINARAQDILMTTHGPDVPMIETLVCDIVENVDSSAASTAELACGRGLFIESNYDYDAGVAILSTKQSYYYIAQTWVTIEGTRFIIDPQTNSYWNETDHETEFGESYKIEFVPVKKGTELVKSCTDYWATCGHNDAITHGIQDDYYAPSPIATPGHDVSYLSSVPNDYYTISTDQYLTDHKLYNYLDGYTWNRPLVRGAGWGLPEAAELEHELSEMGCNVSIRCANVRTTIDHSEFKNRVLTDGYARSGCQPTLDQTWVWLMIEYQGEIVAYEVYGSYWVFKPDSVTKDEYVSNGKWHDWWNYKENMTWVYDGSTWTMYGFKDFSNIYELEEYYLSGGARADCINRCKDGLWCSYYTSNDYNATDHFLIEFGWWMTEDEYHETETRINKATDWFVLVD